MVHMDHLKVHLGAHVGHFVAHMGNLGIRIRMSTVILGNQIIMAMHFACFKRIIRKYYWHRDIEMIQNHCCIFVPFALQ